MAGKVVMLMLIVGVLIADQAWGQLKFQQSENKAVIGGPREKLRGMTVSSMGIIILIAVFMALGVGLYYIYFCYPNWSEKQRKYDRIDLAAM